MGARTTGREAALEMLFALDTIGEPCEESTEQVIMLYWAEFPGDAEIRPFADELVRGVRAGIGEIDRAIATASKHWRIERMARVDRNVLRVGVHELLCGERVPRAVIIDEAIELAKRYGAEESSVFVNGVLDRIAEELGRK